ncbi:MAG: TonB family protein, partial [Blastocatellia bacterium]
VKAYLTGLDEELTELEFQFRHREITRAIYDRTKQRLAVRRRYVERISAKNAEDRVPELQVLADDELIFLKLDTQPNPDELETGDELSRRWRVVSIERAANRFFVLEKLLPVEISRIAPERKLDIETILRDAIETITVREESSEPQSQTQQTSSATPVVPTAEPTTAAPVETVNIPAPKPNSRNPQLLHIYLPEYTSKAREKKIEGDVVVGLTLQRDGKIKKVKVEKGLGHGLDERSVEAVKRLAFLPAELEGRTVDATMQIVFSFKLEKVTLYVGQAELAKGK